jgi:hypothetical protein
VRATSGTATYLSMTNSDKDLLRLFIAWVGDYLQPDAVFVLSLHLQKATTNLLPRRTGGQL